MINKFPEDVPNGEINEESEHFNAKYLESLKAVYPGVKRLYVKEDRWKPIEIPEGKGNQRKFRVYAETVPRSTDLNIIGYWEGDEESRQKAEKTVEDLIEALKLNKEGS